MTQRIIEIVSPLFVDEDRLQQAGSLQALFPETGPLALEIGCGIGDFVLQRARQRPQTNFLAIDIYNKGCLKTCRRLERAGVTNVRVLRIEARYLIRHYCGRGELAAVYINCPDPWPKKRHRKRRLVNRDFLVTLRHHLAPEGDLYFSSDVADYAREVAATLETLPGFRNRLSAPWTPPAAGYPVSKYMQRFLDAGQTIHFIHVRRDPSWQAEPRDLPAVQAGFRTRWGLAGND